MTEGLEGLNLTDRPKWEENPRLSEKPLAKVLGLSLRTSLGNSHSI